MLKIFYEAMDCVHIVHNEHCKSWNMQGRHYHNAYELYMLTEGERRVFINDREYLLKPWELLIIEPYRLHYFLRGTEYITRYVMNIPVKIFNSLLEDEEIEYLTENLHTCVIPLENQAREDIIKYFEQIEYYNYCVMPVAKKMTICTLMQFLVFLKKMYSGALRPFKTENFDISGAMIEAINFIHNSYSDINFSLRTVTEHIHMSESRFCEVFRKTTGQTFLKYLNSIRAAGVEKELWYTSKPLQQLVEEYGFSSVAHMTRVFKAAYGVPPSKYRNIRKRSETDGFCTN